MDVPRPPLLLIPSPPEPLDVHVHIPRPDDNVFERLIRDPQAPDRPARERQCAEMLRVVLVTCSSVRSAILQRLGQIAGLPTVLVDELDWTVETEQPIGSKRDDLRIEGWTTDPDDPQRVVLWTVEIKVAAPIHESGLQEWETEVDPDVDTPSNREMVSQLLNYDRWLAHQSADHKAGFVLAIRDTAAGLPEELQRDWNCIRWKDLAVVLVEALAADDIPDKERLLAEHTLGFIRHRLWDHTDMTNSRLEFDDIALLRAHAAIGTQCSNKVRDVVRRFHPLFESTEIEFREVKVTANIFDRSGEPSYYVWAGFSPQWSQALAVNAGIIADRISVWIACNPNAGELKQTVRRLLVQKRAEIAARNPGWWIADVDDTDRTDLSISMPLAAVLTIEDWQAPLIEFVKNAIDDLLATGVLEGMSQLGHAFN